MEDIFGEQNVKTICIKMSEATGVKMASVIKNGRIPKIKEYLVIAKKNGKECKWKMRKKFLS